MCCNTNIVSQDELMAMTKQAYLKVKQNKVETAASHTNISLVELRQAVNKYPIVRGLTL